jgi:glycosyltransferase involved in cell wall biosynthesis
MIFLGDQPPPLHGMSKINQDLIDILKKKKNKVHVINTVPSSKAMHFNSSSWFFRKLYHSAHVLAQYTVQLSSRSNTVVYRPINGGHGQLFDIVYIVFARIFGKKIFIHHHSFNYFRRRSLLFQVLHFISGKQSVHVVLGQEMAEKLKSVYGVLNSCIRIVPNSAFFESAPSKKENLSRTTILVIGHLANLSNDKGLGVFAKLCHSLHAQKIPFEAKIAGPFSTDSAKHMVQSLCRDLPCVQYMGPLYDEEKSLFFEELDVFVFPSRYKNEAEPLVLYEAAQHGVYLVGSTAGCMRSSIERLGGLAAHIDQDDEWVELVKINILKFFDSIKDENKRNARKESFNKLIDDSIEQLHDLTKEIARAEA